MKGEGKSGLMMTKNIGVLIGAMLIGGAVWAVSGHHAVRLVAADKTPVARLAPRESKRPTVEPVGRRGGGTTNAEHEPIVPSHDAKNTAPTGQAD